MGFRDFLTTRKRRLLSGVQIPMHTEALLSQIKDTVALSRHLPFDPPHMIETFYQLIDMYPLLYGLLSELQARHGTLFWDTYGEWLLHKVNNPVPSLESPRIGPAAHGADIRALKFATHHLWPASFWRDKHCYRCFMKELGARPLRLANKQCARHACQSWALRLLGNLHEQYPGFSPRTLLPRRDSRSTRRRRSSSKSPAGKGSRRRSSPPNRPAGNTEQQLVTTVIMRNTNELIDEKSNQEEQTDTHSSARRRSSSRGSGYEIKESIKQNPSPRLTMDYEHSTPVVVLTGPFDAYN